MRSASSPLAGPSCAWHLTPGNGGIRAIASHFPKSPGTGAGGISAVPQSQRVRALGRTPKCARAYNL